MQNTASIADIQARASKIGVSLTRLAERAGVSPSTALRGARGKHESRRSTERKLDIQLAAIERDVLLHLILLHGNPADWPQQGRAA